MQSSYLVTLGYNYIGAEADINVWNPKVTMPNDFTTAQIWLKNNNGEVFESVESGWMVSSRHKTYYLYFRLYCMKTLTYYLMHVYTHT